MHPSADLGRELLDGLEATGYLVRAESGAPGALHVRAKYEDRHDPNFTLVLSGLTLCVLPGRSTTTRSLLGEVVAADGQRHEFRVACTDDNWMWVPFLPIGCVQFMQQKDGSWTYLDGLPEGLVAFLLDRGIL